MIPSFEKRVRAFAIDTSGVTLFVILSSFLGVYWRPLPWIISGLAFLGFYIIPYIISEGQTFGKRIQKIKVVDIEGGPAPLWRVLAREIFKLGLSFITFGLYLVIAFFAMSEKTSQTIHDKIFKTKLIDLQKPLNHKSEPILGKSESMKKRGIV